MKRNPASSSVKRTDGRQDVNLDGQYRQIGISAVLAALPYQDNAKPAADEAGCCATSSGWRDWPPPEPRPLGRSDTDPFRRDPPGGSVSFVRVDRAGDRAGRRAPLGDPGAPKSSCQTRGRRAN